MLNGYQPNDSTKPPKYINGDTNAVHIRNLDAWSTLEAFKTGVQSFDYQSPIEIIYNQIQCDFEKQLEKNVIQAVQSYGIKVDRDELIKALQYDRRQYEKGFEDARKQFERQQGEWIETNSNDENIICPFCKTEFNGDIKLICGGENPKFCPDCGARMVGGSEDGKK